jgi:IrrE N-terminal-like domain
MAGKSRIWKSAAARRLLELAGTASSVEEAISIVAGKVLSDVSHPPIRLETLLEKLRISEIKTEGIPHSGELRPENGRFTIVCSTYLSPVRRRFTIAHEMAHAIFELSGPNCPRKGFELERLCDMLATELLMPRGIFISHAGTNLDADRIFELARTFQTSLAATAIRCAELLNLSIFEAENDVIRWGHGAIRKGPVRLLDADLQKTILEAYAAKAGRAVVPLTIRGNVRRWNVNFRAMGKNRSLFVLRPEQLSLRNGS